MGKKNGTAYILLEEQETIIRYSRIEDFAEICTSDTTEKTKLFRLIKTSPQHWSLVSDDGIFMVCRCTPKSLISKRSKKTERNLTEAQRDALSQRMREQARKDVDE